MGDFSVRALIRAVLDDTDLASPDWSDGHSHNDALRIASKAILRDLWRAARAWHHQPEPNAA